MSRSRPSSFAMVEALCETAERIIAEERAQGRTNTPMQALFAGLRLDNDERVGRALARQRAARRAAAAAAPAPPRWWQRLLAGTTLVGLPGACAVGLAALTLGHGDAALGSAAVFFGLLLVPVPK